MTEFSGKIVAITGAGSGIGRALARNLAARGARLALADYNAASLAETQAMLPAGTRSECTVLDVSSREQMFAFADKVMSDFGRTDYIVNNAGTSVLATTEHVTIEEIEKVLNVNLWGTIYGTKAFLPHMLKQRSGCIVNVSSVFGLVATPCSVAYTMSKFAVRGLTETMWDELQGTGVRAVLIHPGGIATNITSNTTVAAHHGELEQVMALANARQMTTTPEDCAQEIVTGLLSGKRRLLVGSGAKALFRLSRLFPDSYGRIMRKKLGI
ncbi:SDR family oxidoreductase [Novosphingobium sp. MMS21-SN21R]|uniref:SDR family NAD(P)-dependent oxidoreductase n=1 Tax=Novosphingobium sp. MMS21-SN21R TaxID=2969298 RepID=UPI002888964D|nr:SDR family oxidoreductase [Novosphingobium sp. MMS21-SN21R]MDT0507022.1 SDR family oxidoreductase [Novosphingobium sp. MMS21-SN21R]